MSTEENLSFYSEKFGFIRTYGDLAAAVKGCTTKADATALKLSVEAAGWHDESIPFVLDRMNTALVGTEILDVLLDHSTLSGSGWIATMDRKLTPAQWDEFAGRRSSTYDGWQSTMLALADTRGNWSPVRIFAILRTVRGCQDLTYTVSWHESLFRHYARPGDGMFH